MLKTAAPVCGWLLTFGDFVASSLSLAKLLVCCFSWKCHFLLDAVFFFHVWTCKERCRLLSAQLFQAGALKKFGAGKMQQMSLPMKMSAIVLRAPEWSTQSHLTCHQFWIQSSPHIPSSRSWFTKKKKKCGRLGGWSLAQMQRPEVGSTSCKSNADQSRSNTDKQHLSSPFRSKLQSSFPTVNCCVAKLSSKDIFNQHKVTEATCGTISVWTLLCCQKALAYASGGCASAWTLFH